MVEKSRRMMQEADADRDQRLREARRARESLRRAQALIRRATAAAARWLT